MPTPLTFLSGVFTLQEGSEQPLTVRVYRTGASAHFQILNTHHQLLAKASGKSAYGLTLSYGDRTLTLDLEFSFQLQCPRLTVGVLGGEGQLVTRHHLQAEEWSALDAGLIHLYNFHRQDVSLGPLFYTDSDDEFQFTMVGPEDASALVDLLPVVTSAGTTLTDQQQRDLTPYRWVDNRGHFHTLDEVHQHHQMPSHLPLEFQHTVAQITDVIAKIKRSS
jgi:hypothetical protein